MATNCLVTKLKGSVQNDNLPIYNKLKVTASVIESIDISGQTIRIYGPASLEIVGDGYFVSSDPGAGHWSDGTNSIGKTYSVPADWTNVYFSRGNYNIYIDNKYNFAGLAIMAGYAGSIDFDEFAYMKLDNMTELSAVSSDKTCGNLYNIFRRIQAGHNFLISAFRTNVSLSLKDLLKPDVVCNITLLDLRECPNITDKDSETIAALQEKFPNLNLLI